MVYSRKKRVKIIARGRRRKTHAAGRTHPSAVALSRVLSLIVSTQIASTVSHVSRTLLPLLTPLAARTAAPLERQQLLCKPNRNCCVSLEGPSRVWTTKPGKQPRPQGVRGAPRLQMYTSTGQWLACTFLALALSGPSWQRTHDNSPRQSISSSGSGAASGLVGTRTGWLLPARSRWDA